MRRGSLGNSDLTTSPLDCSPAQPHFLISSGHSRKEPQNVVVQAGNQEAHLHASHSLPPHSIQHQECPDHLLNLLSFLQRPTSV